MNSNETGTHDLVMWFVVILGILILTALAYYGSRMLDAHIYPQVWAIAS